MRQKRGLSLIFVLFTLLVMSITNAQLLNENNPEGNFERVTLFGRSYFHDTSTGNIYYDYGSIPINLDGEPDYTHFFITYDEFRKFEEFVEFADSLIIIEKEGVTYFQDIRNGDLYEYELKEVIFDGRTVTGLVFPTKKVKSIVMLDSEEEELKFELSQEREGTPGGLVLVNEGPALDGIDRPDKQVFYYYNAPSGELVAVRDSDIGKEGAIVYSYDEADELWVQMSQKEVGILFGFIKEDEQVAAKPTPEPVTHPALPVGEGVSVEPNKFVSFFSGMFQDWKKLAMVGGGLLFVIFMFIMIGKRKKKMGLEPSKPLISKPSLPSAPAQTPSVAAPSTAPTSTKPAEPVIPITKPEVKDDKTNLKDAEKDVKKRVEGEVELIQAIDDKGKEIVFFQKVTGDVENQYHKLMDIDRKLKANPIREFNAVDELIKKWDKNTEETLSEFSKDVKLSKEDINFIRSLKEKGLPGKHLKDALNNVIKANSVENKAVKSEFELMDKEKAGLTKLTEGLTNHLGKLKKGMIEKGKENPTIKDLVGADAKSVEQFQKLVERQDEIKKALEAVHSKIGKQSKILEAEIKARSKLLDDKEFLEFIGVCKIDSKQLELDYDKLEIPLKKLFKEGRAETEQEGKALFRVNAIINAEEKLIDNPPGKIKIEPVSGKVKPPPPKDVPLANKKREPVPTVNPNPNFESRALTKEENEYFKKLDRMSKKK